MSIDATTGEDTVTIRAPGCLSSGFQRYTMWCRKGEGLVPPTCLSHVLQETDFVVSPSDVV